MPDSAAQTLRAAIYARVSSEEQREGQTIDSQIAELERFARERRWDLVGVYKDEGWSGALLNRPALDRLRDNAARKQFDLVLLNDVDRLARDVAHLGIVKRDLERSGVRVVFRKLPSEESPTYNLMVNILGSFAEFEREMIADRTRRGRRHKVEVRQQFLGAIASYGYRYIPKDRASGQDGYLAVVPEEASLVRQMYEWVDSEGLSAHQVVERLKQLQARPRKGGRWAKSTVLRILRNETYAGVWHYNKHYSSEPLKQSRHNRYQRALKSSNRLRPREEWLPVILPAELRIISRDLWQRVQQQLTKNVTFSPRNAKHTYLLKGLVRCGGCGAGYSGDPCHGKYYYRCINRCKRMPTVREKHLDEAVWGAVSEAILNPDIILDQVSKLHERAVKNERSSTRESQVVQRALERIQKEEARLLEAYRTGIISPSQLGQELEQLKQRKGSLELRAVSLGKSTEGSEDRNLRLTLEEYCQAAAERLQTFTDSERQHFLRLLIDNVIFEGTRVRIRAVIPPNNAEQGRRNIFWQTSEMNPVSVNTNPTMYRDYPARIGDTFTHHDVHNSVSKNRVEDIATNHSVLNSVERKGRVVDTVSDHDGRNSVQLYQAKSLISEVNSFKDHISFEMIRALPEKPFSIVSEEGLALVRHLVARHPQATLQELCYRVKQERGVVVYLSPMSRALKILGLSSRSRRQAKVSNAA